MRSVTPMVRKTLVRCALTVFSLIESRRAMSLLLSPSASSSEHLALPVGEAVLPGGRACAEEGAGGLGIERDVTGGRRTDCAGELLRLGVLEEVAGRAGVERTKDPLAVGERREHDDRDSRLALLDPTCRLDPVQHGHLDVHQDDVRHEVRRTTRPPRRRSTRHRRARPRRGWRRAATGRPGRLRGRRRSRGGSRVGHLEDERRSTAVGRAELQAPAAARRDLLQERQADMPFSAPKLEILRARTRLRRPPP